MDEMLFRQILSEEISKAMENTVPEVLTLDQACSYLQVSDTWLKANLEKERIPYFKTGRHYKFNLSELREWTKEYSLRKQKTVKINKPIKRKANSLLVSL